MRTDTPSRHFLLCSIIAVSFVLLLPLEVQAQDHTYPPKKPIPAGVLPDLLILSEEVVQNQWPASLDLVNAPADLQQVQSGQCIRFGVTATGDERDHLLKSSRFSFELTSAGKRHDFTAESPGIVKQIKPQGGDFVTQALGVAGIKNPVLSMASLAASQVRWCVPLEVQDGTVNIVATAVLENGKSVSLKARKLEVRSFEGAHSKPSFTDMKTFAPWLQAYHHAPEPAHLLAGLRIVAADPNARSAYNIMSFFVAALKASPAAQNDIAHHMPAERPVTRIYALPLLKLAGYNVEPLLRDFSEEDRAILRSVEIPDPYDIKPDRTLPDKMDMLWATFFANGRIEAVKTIASMLAWREDYDKFQKMRESGQQPTELTDSIMRAVVYSAAGWSLSALSRNDGVVADYVDALKHSPETPEVVKRELSGLYANPAFTRN